MAESPPGSREEVAYKLLMVLLRVENKRIVGFNDNGENTDGSWLLKAYEDCLTVASGSPAPTRPAPSVRR